MKARRIPHRTRARLVTRLGWLVLAVAPMALRAQAPATDVARVVVTRPTVVAYFVARQGEVDTLPDLAVAADDWNYAMAALGDSLAAHGVAHVLVTQPRLRVASRGAAPVTFTLGETSATGYVFVRPGRLPCIRRGYLEPDSVLAMARALVGATSRDSNHRCDRGAPGRGPYH